MTRRPVDQAGYTVARHRTNQLWAAMDDAIALDTTGDTHGRNTHPARTPHPPAAAPACTPAQPHPAAVGRAVDDPGHYTVRVSRELVDQLIDSESEPVIVIGLRRSDDDALDMILRRATRADFDRAENKP